MKKSHDSINQIAQDWDLNEPAKQRLRDLIADYIRKAAYDVAKCEGVCFGLDRDAVSVRCGSWDNHKPYFQDTKFDDITMIQIVSDFIRIISSPKK